MTEHIIKLLDEAKSEEQFQQILAQHSPKDDDLIDLPTLLYVAKIGRDTALKLFSVSFGGTKLWPITFALGHVTDVLLGLNPDVDRVWPGIGTDGKHGRFLTPKQVADMGGRFVDTDMLSRWRRMGIGPAFVKFTSKTFRYTPEAIAHWLAEEASDQTSLVGR